jgi:hypothetical protein
MDELPDLRSDADVDALMARIHARIAPVSQSAAQAPSAVGENPPGALDALVAAQETLAATMARALQVVAESLEELEVQPAQSPVPPVPTGARPAPSRRAPQPRAARTAKTRNGARP